MKKLQIDVHKVNIMIYNIVSQPVVLISPVVREVGSVVLTDLQISATSNGSVWKNPPIHPEPLQVFVALGLASQSRSNWIDIIASYLS